MVLYNYTTMQVICLFVLSAAAAAVGVNGAHEVLIAVVATGDGGGGGGGPTSHFIAGDIHKGDFEGCQIPMLPYTTGTNMETLQQQMSNLVAMSMGNDYIFFDDFVGNKGPHSIATYNKQNNSWDLGNKASFDTDPVGYTKMDDERLFILFRNSIQTGIYGKDGQQQFHSQQLVGGEGTLDYNFHTITKINDTHLVAVADRNPDLAILFFLDTKDNNVTKIEQDQNNIADPKVGKTCIACPPYSAVCLNEHGDLWSITEHHFGSFNNSHYPVDIAKHGSIQFVVGLDSSFLLAINKSEAFSFAHDRLDFFTYDACKDLEQVGNVSPDEVFKNISYYTGGNETVLGIYPLKSRSIFACIPSTNSNTTTNITGYTSTTVHPPMTSGATRDGGNGSWNLSPQVWIIIILGVYAFMRI